MQDNGALDSLLVSSFSRIVCLNTIIYDIKFPPRELKSLRPFENLLLGTKLSHEGLGVRDSIDAGLWSR